MESRDWTPFKKRRLLRVPGFDYSTPNTYCVTICTHHRRHAFGRVKHRCVELSDLGLAVAAAWRALPQRFPAVTLDTFIVMPNHMHGLLGIREAPTPRDPVALGQVIGAFKSLTTQEYRAGVERGDWEGIGTRLWMRGYIDRIVRDDRELDVLSRYIEENPETWERDRHFR